MKNKASKLTFILVIIIISIASVLYYIGHTERIVAEIKSQFDTKLIDYEANKNLALSYLDVVAINSAERFSEVRDKLYPNLSPELQNDLFGPENNKSFQSEEIKYIVVDVKGTFEENNEGNEQTFKIQYYTVINYKTEDYLALIKVENGLIVSAKTFIV